MNSSARLKMLLGLQLFVGASVFACGGEDDPMTTGDVSDAGGQEPTGNGTLQLTYSPMYSAFIEGHEAQVPVMLKDTSLRGSGAKFTSSDPTIAVVTDTEQGGMITVKKEGTVTIKAALDGDTGAAKLTITKFTEDQWKLGQARYSKSELAIKPTRGGPVAIITLATDRASYNSSGACNTCHTAQAKTLKIENTPTQIAGYSDEELITIFTMGKKPDNVKMQSQIPAFAWGMFHAWTVTDDEKPGLIAFLRTQAPKANPATIDYGVKPCPGAMIPAGGGIPPLCDNDGNPVMIPGLPGQSGGTDAGKPSTTTTPDAGTTTTSDAGVTAGDAG
jgi:hypothetical protein